jgi:hypothetical protein
MVHVPTRVAAIFVALGVVVIASSARANVGSVGSSSVRAVDGCSGCCLSDLATAIAYTCYQAANEFCSILNRHCLSHDSRIKARAKSTNRSLAIRRDACWRPTCGTWRLSDANGLPRRAARPISSVPETFGT